VVVVENDWWSSKIHDLDRNFNLKRLTFAASIDWNDSSTELISFRQVHADILADTNRSAVDLAPPVITSSELNEVASNLCSTVE